jgi:hypothetical protein
MQYIDCRKTSASFFETEKELCSTTSKQKLWEPLEDKESNNSAMIQTEDSKLNSN